MAKFPNKENRTTGVYLATHTGPSCSIQLHETQTLFRRARATMSTTHITDGGLLMGLLEIHLTGHLSVTIDENFVLTAHCEGHAPCVVFNEDHVLTIEGSTGPRATFNVSGTGAGAACSLNIGVWMVNGVVFNTQGAPVGAAAARATPVETYTYAAIVPNVHRVRAHGYSRAALSFPMSSIRCYMLTASQHSVVDFNRPGTTSEPMGLELIASGHGHLSVAAHLMNDTLAIDTIDHGSCSVSGRCAINRARIDTSDHSSVRFDCEGTMKILTAKSTDHTALAISTACSVTEGRIIANGYASVQKCSGNAHRLVFEQLMLSSADHAKVGGMHALARLSAECSGRALLSATYAPGCVLEKLTKGSLHAPKVRVLDYVAPVAEAVAEEAVAAVEEVDVPPVVCTEDDDVYAEYIAAHQRLDDEAARLAATQRTLDAKRLASTERRAARALARTSKPAATAEPVSEEVVVSVDEVDPVVAEYIAARQRLAATQRTLDAKRLARAERRAARALARTSKPAATAEPIDVDAEGATTATGDGQRECAICMERPADTLRDCCHLCACATCAMKVDMCPICRAPWRGPPRKVVVA